MLAINQSYQSPNGLNGGEKRPFDWDEAGEMLGLNLRQIKFAQAMARGANQTQAARAAGYKGQDAQLRQAGHRVAKSPGVQSLIKWASVEGAGIPDSPCDADELKKILSKHARGADKSASIRAAEVLHRLDQHEAESARLHGKSSEPEDILERIATIDPGYALRMARKNGFADWVPAGWESVECCATCGQPISPMGEEVSEGKANGLDRPGADGSLNGVAG